MPSVMSRALEGSEGGSKATASRGDENTRAARATLGGVDNVRPTQSTSGPDVNEVPKNIPHFNPSRQLATQSVPGLRPTMNSRDPRPQGSILRLPQEILSRIFRMAQEPLVDDTGRMHKTNFKSEVKKYFEWTRLPQVCSYFRNVGFSTASLWDTIVFVDGVLVGGCPGFVDVACTRPRWLATAYPLTLVLEPTGLSVAYLTELLSQAHRIEQVYLVVNDDWEEEQIELLEETLLPRLRTLVVHAATSFYTPDPMQLLFKGQLQSVQSLAIHAHTLYPTMHLDQLRHLVIDNSLYNSLEEVDSLFGFLRSAPNLEDAAFKNTAINFLNFASDDHLDDSNLRKITFDDARNVSSILEFLGLPAGVQLYHKWTKHQDWEGDVLPELARRGELTNFKAARIDTIDDIVHLHLLKGASELHGEYLAWNEKWKCLLAELCTEVTSLWLTTVGKAVRMPNLLRIVTGVKQLVLEMDSTFDLSWAIRTMIPKRPRRRAGRKRTPWIAQGMKVEELYIVSPPPMMCEAVVHMLTERKEKLGVKVRKLSVKTLDNEAAKEWEGEREFLKELVEEFEVGVDVEVPVHTSEA